MKKKHILPFICNDGRSADMDLCCFCKKLKDLHHSGDCEHYEDDYVDNACPGFVEVDDVGKRVNEILECRSSL